MPRSWSQLFLTGCASFVLAACSSSHGPEDSDGSPGDAEGDATSSWPPSNGCPLDSAPIEVRSEPAEPGCDFEFWTLERIEPISAVDGVRFVTERCDLVVANVGADIAERIGPEPPLAVSVRSDDSYAGVWVCDIDSPQMLFLAINRSDILNPLSDDSLDFELGTQTCESHESMGCRSTGHRIRAIFTDETREHVSEAAAGETVRIGTSSLFLRTLDEANRLNCAGGSTSFGTAQWVVWQEADE